jgi:hypothetical protein
VSWRGKTIPELLFLPAQAPHARRDVQAVRRVLTGATTDHAVAELGGKKRPLMQILANAKKH